MPADVSPTGTHAGPDRTSLTRLVAAFASARTPESVAERLLEHVLRTVPGAHARVYILGPGDRCAACPRARDCTARER